MKIRTLFALVMVLALLTACGGGAATTGGQTTGKPLRIAVVMPSATTDSPSASRCGMPSRRSRPTWAASPQSS